MKGIYFVGRQTKPITTSSSSVTSVRVVINLSLFISEGDPRGQRHFPRPTGATGATAWTGNLIISHQAGGRGAGGRRMVSESAAPV